MKATTAQRIDSRLFFADGTHGPLTDNAHCLGALHLEVREVEVAMQARDITEVYEELLDVATVAIRYAEAIEAKAKPERTPS